MKRIITVVALVAALAAPVAAQAALDDGAVFRTPGKAAYCNYGLDLPPLTVGCWTPNDGFTVYMSMRGRPYKYYEHWNRGHVDNSAPLLRFGRATRLAGVVCVSRSTGLTCVNQRGHGWWLGRYIGYRLF